MSRRSPASSSPRKPRRKGVSGPSPAALAAALVEAVAPDLAHPDPLQAQLAASFVVADALDAYWDAIASEQQRGETGDDVPRPAIASLRLLAELRDPSLRNEALALVVALGSLDPNDDAVQGAAGEAAKRLRFLGAKPPSWAEAIAAPELLGIWVVRDVFSESMTYYLGARFPGSDVGHCVAARVAQLGHAELVDVFVAEGPEVLVPEVERALAEDPEASLLRLESPSRAQAAQLLWDVVAGVEETFGEELDDDAFDVISLLEARLSLLDTELESASDEELARTSHRTSLDELDEPAIVEQFLASDGYRTTDGTHEQLAPAIVAWASGSIADGLARMSPNLVLELLSALAHAAETDEQRALLLEHGVPTTLAWVRFTSALVGLPQEAIDVLEQVATSAGDDFDHLVRHGAPPSAGMSDRLLELMLEDGVDPGSQDELDAWSAAWNELTDEQRIARMDA
jgi:hypothetical protein